MYGPGCGVVPILFGWFLRVPSLHALVFTRKTFWGLVLAVFRSGKREERWGRKVRGRCMVCEV